MRNLVSVFVFSLLPPMSFLGYGQGNCPRDKVIGEWTEITNMPGIYSNVDSLRNLMNNWNSETVGVWNFSSEGIYTFKSSYSDKNYRQGQAFNFDSSTCEIILWSKTKSRTKRVSTHNLEIIHLDNEFLVYKSDDNPKGYYTHLMKRK